ncbi:hypothetical protein PH4_000001 [Escherichia phage PH4]|nr:hypothetical protein PC3_000001 [Escherichia phage PC3]URX66170.1 hypothetical protein PH4_000001 [Escherichia phage PH4]
MANKPTQPVFPLGLVAEEQSTLAGVVNTGTIEHGPDAVLTLPEGNASAGLPSSVRYNADSDEFEGFYENGGWLPLGGGGIRWEVLPHASTVTLTEGRGYLINNTTGASTVVLPSPTRIGDSVTICDAYGKFATYPLTVSPSGNNLYGSTEDMAITTDNVSATFTWSGPEQGWIITSGVGLGQGRVYSREIFTKILASETSSVALNTPPTIVDVYADGKRLSESKYSLDGNVITFSPSLPPNTELQVIEYTPIQLGNGGGSSSSTITWVYNGGSAIGGETEITLDVVVDDVPAIDINGSRQYKNLGFTFDPLTSKITLAQELEPEDEVVVIINGTPNIYNQIDYTLREVARVTNVKDTEVVYFSVGAALSGYKVIYDKETQRAYPLPADIAPGTTAISLSPSAVLVHSAGSVDLGELAVSREEYVTLSGSFDTGVTVNTKNELVVFTDGKYRWDGELPKEVSAGSTPGSAGGTGAGKWLSVGDVSLRSDLADDDGVDLVNGAVKDKDFELYKRQSIAKNRFNFAFGNKYSRSFNNNLRLQLQTYVENVFNFAPKAVSLPSGRVVCIYTVKDGANIDPGQDGTPMHIDYLISDDNGVNWTTGTVVNKGPGYATSETVLFLNNLDGYLYCFFTSMKGITGWGHAQQGTNPDTTSTIEYVISKDGGNTWSTPVDITPLVKPSGAYFSSIAPTQVGYINGKPAIPYYYLTQLSTGIVEGYITVDDSGNYTYGEDVRKDTDTDTLGTSGGEIGFGNFYDGTPFAIERAADTTTKPYKIAIQKLLMQDSSGKWVVKGQFPTTNCMASFLRVGPDYGFDKDYLFVIAPVGQSGNYEGRANIRVFDCSDDFSNPIDRGMITDTNALEAGYSSTVLLSSGSFMSMWNGRQWTISNSIYTINRLAGNVIIPVPFCGTIKIVDIRKTFAPDLRINERVIGLADGKEYTWNGSSFVLGISSPTKTLTTETTTLDANSCDVFYLDAGSNGSVITSITGGYIGQRISILPLSGNTVVTLSKQASGVSVTDRIMYNTETGKTKYKTNGEIVELIKTNYGWYLNKSANAS